MLLILILASIFHVLRKVILGGILGGILRGILRGILGGISGYAFYIGSLNSGTEVTHPELFFVLIGGCSVLSLINAYQLFHPEPDLPKDGSWLGSLLTIPIQTFMLQSRERPKF